MALLLAGEWLPLSGPDANCPTNAPQPSRPMPAARPEHIR